MGIVAPQEALLISQAVPSDKAASLVVITDDSNGNHHYAMNHELEKRQKLGSDILIALADKISGRKGRKKQLLHSNDLSFLGQFNAPMTVMNEMVAPLHSFSIHQTV